MAAEKIGPLLGTWKCDKSRDENFSELLTLMGTGMIQKKIVTAANPTLTLSLEDNCLVIKKEVGPKTMVTRFPLDGTAVEDNTPSGGTAMVSIEIGDGVITSHAKTKEGKPDGVTTKQIVNGELLQTINVGDGKLIAKRYFTKK